MPAALILSSAAISSSQSGRLRASRPCRDALLIQIQLVEWTLTGAATQLPSYLENFCSAAGMTSSQPSLAATSSRLPSTPCSAQSVNVEAEHLHGGRRIAGGDAGAQHGHRLRRRRRRRPACPSRRCPCACEIFLQHVERRGLAAGGPPVQHLDVCGLGEARRRGEHGKCREGLSYSRTHSWVSSSVALFCRRCTKTVSDCEPRVRGCGRSASRPS